MKIDDPKWKSAGGNPLSSFDTGACIRLVQDDTEMFVGAVYIVCDIEEKGRLAINLSRGTYRDDGLFVLEPNAKVVIG